MIPTIFDKSPKSSGLKCREAIAFLNGHKVTIVQNGPPPWINPNVTAMLSCFWSFLAGMAAWTQKAQENGYIDHRNDTYEMFKKENMTVHNDDYWMPATEEGFQFGLKVFFITLASILVFERMAYGTLKAGVHLDRYIREYPNKKIERLKRIIQAECHGEEETLKKVNPKLIRDLLPFLDEKGFESLDFSQTKFLKENSPEEFELHKMKFSKKLQGRWASLNTLTSLTSTHLSRALSQEFYTKQLTKKPEIFLTLIHSLNKDCLYNPAVGKKLIPLLKNYAVLEENIDLKDDSQYFLQLLKLMNQDQCLLSEAMCKCHRENPEVGDFTIHLSQTSIKFNSSLLVEMSDYFRALINGFFQEKNFTEHYIQESLLDERAIIASLDFIKTGILVLPEKTLEALISVAEAANFYGIPLLAKEVEARLLNMLEHANNDQLYAILAMSFDYNYTVAHEKAQKKYLLMNYISEQGPEPFSKKFIKELAFCTNNQLKICLYFLQQSFSQKCQFDPPLFFDERFIANHLANIAEKNSDFFTEIFPTLRPIFEYNPLILKLLWDEGSGKKQLPRVTELINEFCKQKENQHIMLAYFNAPPIPKVNLEMI